VPGAEPGDAEVGTVSAALGGPLLNTSRFANAESPLAETSPEVSVVVIFKDADDFVEEAIESVRAQTFSDWELILVDDGSTDASTAIALRYAEQGAGRVRYYEHPGHANLGMSATRNLGVSRARGEFVAFLDADDVLVPTTLEKAIAILRAHPRVGMVYGQVEYWYGWTGHPEDQARDFIHPVGVPTDRVYEPPSLIAHFIQNDGYAPAGLIFRRALFEQVGGYEESFWNLYEDQVFAAKVCAVTPVFASELWFHRYRQHPNACCVTAEQGRVDAARLRFLRWLVAYLEDEGLAGSDAWRQARKEVRRRSRTGRLLARVAGAGRRVRQRAAPAGSGGGMRQ
jgi:glycosyltransferase involved in cell wall biosynthesis